MHKEVLRLGKLIEIFKTNHKFISMNKAASVSALLMMSAWGLLAACSKGSPLEEHGETADAEWISPLSLKLDAEARLTPAMREQRRASMILTPYLEMKDSCYVLDISEKDAEKLGVSAAVYKKVVQGLDDSNAAIARARKEGMHLTFPDLDELKATADSFLRAERKS